MCSCTWSPKSCWCHLRASLLLCCCVDVPVRYVCTLFASLLSGSMSHSVLLLFPEQAASSSGVSQRRPAPPLHEPRLDERSLGERWWVGGDGVGGHSFSPSAHFGDFIDIVNTSIYIHIDCSCNAMLERVSLYVLAHIQP